MTTIKVGETYKGYVGVVECEVTVVGVQGDRVTYNVGKGKGECSLYEFTQRFRLGK